MKGQIRDKHSKVPLPGATVVLLNDRDSSLVASVLTTKDGVFNIERLQVGSYRLHITYLGYRSIRESIEINVPKIPVDMGTIYMEKTGLTLATVEIKSPIIVKRDTLEFDASYFPTRENAIIEELLKKLPGVFVDRDGTIRMQGETIKRILIDGRPFFEDDPTMATKNLTADIIDKIQLIDEKSKEAQFTGISDGNDEKVINLIIKKDRKKGLIGGITVGYGTDDRFAISANVNRFGDNHQVSFIGKGNNTNDIQDGKDTRNSSGITRQWNGALNYNTDFGSNLKLHSSYSLNNSRKDNRQNSIKHNFFSDTSWYYNQYLRSVDNGTNHSFNIRMEYQIDTMQMLEIMTNINYILGSNLQENDYETLNSKQDQINSGTTYISGESRNPDFFTSITYRKKLRKAGQTISTGMNFGYGSHAEEIFNISTNSFLNPDGDSFVDSLNQRTKYDNRHRVFQYHITYTEPVIKSSILRLSYLFTKDYSVPEKLSYDFNASKGEYDHLNDSLSNSFKNSTDFHFASASIHTLKTKYDYSLGLNMLYSNMGNKNISLRSNLIKHTSNFYPTVSFNYSFTKTKKLRLNYSADIQAPSINDLQPVLDNRNPLYIKLGNPDLKPGRADNLSVTFNDFNPGNMRSLSANINASVISNKIVPANWLDSLGRQVSQPRNLDGAWNISLNIDNGLYLKHLQTNIKSSTSFTFNRNVNLINGLKGYINDLSISQTLFFSYNHKELFDLTARTNAQYSIVKYSMQNNSNNNSLSYAFSFTGNINLPYGFTVGSIADYTMNIGRAEGFNMNIMMINAFVSKSFFSNKKGLLKFQGFDLLKQNISITRNIGDNYYEDVRTNALQRFFMLSFSYFLNSGRNKSKR
ncbi:outer membrane beta-barrel protein [Chitinophaga japonensis]